MSEDDVDVITLDKPQRGAKDGYLQLFFINRKQFLEFLINENGDDGERVITLTRYMISAVTDDQIRDNLKQKLDKEIAEIQKRSMDNAAKHRELIKVAMDIQGDITAFFDEFLGVTHRLRVGMV